MSPARKKTRRERLFSAAVLRRTFELASAEHRGGFEFVYEGVLRDLELSDPEVRQFLAENGAEVEAALGRHRGVA